jgi:hypothetical protein
MRNFRSTLLLHWEEAYRAALLERDRDRLVERISEARLAIIERVEEIFTEPHERERQEMYDALKGLRALCAECETEGQRNLERSLAINLERYCGTDWPEWAERD